MPRQTLRAIQKRINALKLEARRLERKRRPALRQIVSLARAHSISLWEIRAALTDGGKRRKTTAKKSRRQPSKVKPMYRNPKTDETWSGRGRAARWLAAAEKAGHKRAEFLVKKA